MDFKFVALIVVVVGVFVAMNTVGKKAKDADYFVACTDIESCYEHDAPYSLLLRGGANFTVRVVKPGERPEFDVNYIVIERNTDSYVYRMPLLIRSTILREKCQYVGKFNPYLDCGGENTTHGIFNGFLLQQSGLTQAESAPPDPAEVEKAIQEETENKDLKRRYVFYLAQLHDKAKNLVKAQETYQQRTEMGGWSEEIFYSHYRLGHIHLLNNDTGTASSSFIQAHAVNPHRKEPVYYLARIARVQKNYPLCLLYTRSAEEIGTPDPGALFVESDIYTWKLHDEHALCLYYSGKVSEAKRIWEYLVGEKSLAPEEAKERIRENLKFTKK